MALFTAASVIAPGLSQDAHAPAVTGTMRSLNMANDSHNAIKRITCLGSGFVGGMKLLHMPSYYSGMS